MEKLAGVYEVAFKNALLPMIVVDLKGRVEAINPVFEKTFGHSFEEIKGRNLLEISFIPKTRREQQLVKDIWSGKRKGGVFKVIRMHKSGESIPCEISINPRFDEKGKPVGFVSILRNLSLEEKLQKQQQLFHQTASKLSKELDLNKILPVIAKNAAQVVNADTSLISLAKGNILELKAGYNVPKEIMRIKRLGKKESLTGLVMEQGKPLRSMEEYPAFAFKGLARKAGLESFLGVPLFGRRGKAIGVLNVYTRKQKEFTPQEINLLTAYANQVSIAIEKARLHEKIKQTLHTDQLTNLPNERGFYKSAYRIFKKAVKEKKPLTMIVADLNGLKEFNDTHGHPIGNKVIKAVGNQLKKTVAEKGVVARPHGDEFFILMENHSLEQANELIKEINSRISEWNAKKKFAKETQASISAGAHEIALNKTPAKALEEAYHSADQKMREAKNLFWQESRRRKTR